MHVLIFILSLVLFIGLVLVHEWGHFIVARRNGIEAEEFGLGLPPRAMGRKLSSGMILSLNWLPIGGFVKLRGEHDSDKRPGSFGAASLGAKAKVMLAGVFMNLIVGLVLLTILALVGMPKVLTKDSVGQDQFTVGSDTKISRQAVSAGDILASSPAAKAGLRGTDIIKEVDGPGSDITIKTTSDLHAATQHFAGQNVTLKISRADQAMDIKTRLLTASVVKASQNTDNPKGYLGVAPNQIQIQRSTWSAPIVALGFSKQLTILTLKGVGHALAGLGSLIAGLVTSNQPARQNGSNEATSQVGGPVAIGFALWDYGALGFNFMLWVIAVISLTLAIINVLPIPALDGGRLVMVLGSRLVFKRPLSKAAEENIIGASMVLIFGLIILITLVDVKRFF